MFGRRLNRIFKVRGCNSRALRGNLKVEKRNLEKGSRKLKFDFTIISTF